MSLTLTAALLVSGSVLPQCSWDRPGANAFQGDVVSAVDRYQDIPPDVRAALKRRIAARQYDEMAEITRDSVSGAAHTYMDLRDMHFGAGTVCQTVTRTKWTPSTKERGLVYCEQDHCIIIPTVCRNVSRITRVSKARVGAAAPAGPAAAPAEPMGAPVMVAAAEPAPLPVPFEAPSAGLNRPLAAEGAPAGYGEEIDMSPAAGPGSFQALAAPSSGVSPFPGSTGFPLLPVAAAPLFAGPVPGINAVEGVSVVPEPSAYALAAVGFAALAWLRRRQTKLRAHSA